MSRSSVDAVRVEIKVLPIVTFTLSREAKFSLRRADGIAIPNTSTRAITRIKNNEKVYIISADTDIKSDFRMDVE